LGHLRTTHMSMKAVYFPPQIVTIGVHACKHVKIIQARKLGKTRRV